ncbi:MAG: amidophosphoribosyltransferase [Thermoplasmatales archaeon]|nr:amidophosphoribosyltransferase [Thermoplasmatales archaeon]
MTGPKHSCGVVGISATHDVVSYVHKALDIIQHRGQESAGIAVFSNGEITTVKNNGLVSVALTKESMAGLAGDSGIGHVRYSKSDAKGIVNAQPLTLETTHGSVAVAHNGDITNFEELKKKYLAQGLSFLTDSDSEILALLFSRNMSQTDDPVRALRMMMGEVEGAYSLTVMVNNRVFGVRDPYGFRPLCLGEIDDGYIIVSESAALDSMRGKFIRDIMPGEIIEIMPDRYKSHPLSNTHPKAHCMFEWVYFARPDSIIDGKEVYDVRKRIGIILARESPVDADIVMPVPDSGRAHALGFSIGSGLQYEEGFMKNRFVERTFIIPDQKQRERAVSMKMNPIRSTVRDRRVVIVDDSVVRGTTLKRLVRILRDAGAKEVHVRVGCPPVIAPCYYGVDMRTRDQFIANSYSISEIRDIIGADSLAYISIEGLVEAINLPENDLCLACVNGKYPTNIKGEKHRFQSTLKTDFTQ